jgi:putative ABC transport system permease protein
MMPSRSDRLFRRLLRIFPAEFRGDFGDEMTDVFRDQHRDAERRGTMGLMRLWWETVRGIATTAPREHWDLLCSDVRYGLRTLRRDPGFTSVAVLALAVGIGANAAVFTIVNGVLLRALPYKDPHELIAIFEKIQGAPVAKFDFSAPDFEFIRDHAQSFAGIFAYRNSTFELSGIGPSERLVGTRVSPEIFGVLGVSPVLGRALTPDDDRVNAKVLVLTHATWIRVFGGDPSVVGRTVSVDRQPYTIVGVMGDQFEFPPRGAESNGEPAAFYLPIAFSPFERQAFGSMYNNTVVARLKPGVTVAQARGELTTLQRTLLERYPPVLQRMGWQLTMPMWPFLDEVVGGSRRMILFLMGAVATVLLIGCADVANLMLTRAGSRQREIAVRSALGASPVRLVRQLLTEGVVLSLLGGAGGVLLAYWAVAALRTLAGTSLPRSEAIVLDGRVLGFTAAVALLTPLVFGLVPALRTAVGSTFDGLKEGGRSTGSRDRHRLLGSLVVVQFALAMVLSVSAGLLVRSFVRLLSSNPGFRSEQVVTASVTLPSGRYTTGRQIKDFYRAVAEATQSIPGVESAGAGADRALRTRERRTFTPDPAAERVPTTARVIAATWTVGSYFDALGIQLKRGRFFTDADRQPTPSRGPVVIVSEMLAKRFWPGQDPIGHQLKWGGDESQAPWMTIVGVVGDVSQGALGTDTIPQTYEPIDQQPDRPQFLNFYREIHVVARANRDGAALLTAVRGTLQRLDPALPVTNAQRLDDVVADSVRPQRFSMSLIGVFALVALGLAALGIYGVLANVVTQQTHEIGVRMALGATASAVMWSVVRRALLLMAAGAVIGVIGALAVTRVMAGLLYEVQPTDSLAFGTASLMLAIIALAASVVPAWRATRVDPLVALRAE